MMPQQPNPPSLLQRLGARFREQHTVLWPALSRTANLMAMMNVSLFFLNGAVRCGGSYYPIISLMLLATASLLIVLPLGLHQRLGWYVVVLVLAWAAGWLLGTSILVWLRETHFPHDVLS